MIHYPPTTKIYSYLWNKYRPAILKMMVDSAGGPKQYKFSDHEFRRVNPREKKGYSFTLRVFQSRATNNIKTSAVAQDLLSILKTSRKAVELTEASTYEFILDKHFVFHVAIPDAIPESAPEAIPETIPATVLPE